MSEQLVCIHKLDDVPEYDLLGLRIAARTYDRVDLRSALQSLRPRVLILDADDPSACEIVVESLEILPQLCIIGVTDQSNPQTIVNVIRAGCKQLATKPLDPNDLHTAIRRALNDTQEFHQSGQIYGLISAIGGAGATTLACHLARALVEFRKATTLLVDLDLEFGGVARAWDCNPKFSIADLASAGAVDAILLKRAVCELPKGVSILTRPASIQQAHTLDDTLISQVLRTARGVFPHVIVDLPRRLDALTGAALGQCDKLLIVIQFSVPAVDNARRLMEALTAAGFDADRIEVVGNRYRKNTHMVDSSVVTDNLRKQLFGIVPNDFKTVSRSIDLGEPVDARSPVYRAVQEIAGKLTGQKAPESQGGWFRLLSSRS